MPTVKVYLMGPHAEPIVLKDVAKITTDQDPITMLNSNGGVMLAVPKHNLYYMETEE